MLHSRRLLRRYIAAAALALATAATLGLAPSVASAVTPSVGTGAVAVRSSSGSLVVGATAEIRKGDCMGPAVWRYTTTNRPDAYGAFAFTLPVGEYCVASIAVPAGFTIKSAATFTVEPRSANWVTTWIAAPRPVIVVAKDASSRYVDGMTADIRQGRCDAPGAVVSSGTTATASPLNYGSFASVPVGEAWYCVSARTVPAGFGIPAPVDFYSANWNQPWAVLWLPNATP